MAKRESVTKKIQSLKKEWAKKMAAGTRARKKDEFEKVKAKGKVETFGDIYGVFCGLSKRAIEASAFHEIQKLAALGYGPEMIIERMEPVKKG
jgi:hypothetical protein